MPMFAANLTMLFTELPFMERFAAASKAGFDYVEYLFPYEWHKQELQHQLQTHHLTQILFNLPPGDWDAGERGIASLPGREEEFRAGVDTAIAYAEALKVKQINCLAGLQQGDVSVDQQWQVLLQNVRYAAQKLAEHNIRLLVEPINSRVDMPGFLLDTLDKAKLLLKQAQEPNLGIQFDLYHMQIMHGDVCRLLTQNLPFIQHIQFADNPGRHEPGTGELNYSNIFHTIDELGYEGWVSAEYRPRSDTLESLDWFAPSSTG
ncbi:MAG: hydroxypyruvate isomerase [Oleiphilaceae bacterium]|nr:hydroxypyruvate isomerase [Oleiphilaceae bacterium]